MCIQIEIIQINKWDKEAVVQSADNFQDLKIFMLGKVTLSCIQFTRQN
jgi:hypothetical protein